MDMIYATKRFSTYEWWDKLMKVSPVSILSSCGAGGSKFHG